MSVIFFDICLDNLLLDSSPDLENLLDLNNKYKCADRNENAFFQISLNLPPLGLVTR